MLISVIFFWLSLSILFFCYFGYGAIIFLTNKLNGSFTKRFSKKENRELPSVTLVVAAYNEDSILEQKIKNCLSIDYPSGKLHLLFVTDGSTDDSQSILAKY